MANAEARPTLSDVAARAGVSKSLVSLVMRGEPGAGAETRRRVLDAAGELGYHPDSRARLLRSGRSRLLGVVFGIQHAFHVDLVTGLYTAARAAGYELALSAVTPERDEAEATASLLQDRCEALIMCGPQTSAARLTRLATRLPVVVLARDARNADVVRTADAEGLRQAVEHLAGLGHRRIAHIDGGRAPGSADRRRGYRAAMEAHGLAAHIRIVPGGLTEEEGATAARRLLTEKSDATPGRPLGEKSDATPGRPLGEKSDATPGRPLGEKSDAGEGVAEGRSGGGREDHDGGAPTAITVFNDRCATGVLDVLLRAGVRVPEEISVVGFDDSHLARLAHVNLTTIAQDVPAMTRLAVARAVERIDGAEVSHRGIVVPPHLVVRGTTGPART
ncbi:LacI family DNA-binding transcriptional regulator [Paractinoplanes atraurantiacus]|nr:LacI family DNA-binding transcriptional regulator [Actinoplanes atraurantiacus]